MSYSNGTRVVSSPRQLGDIHINGCLNFSMVKCKVNSPQGSSGEGCLGYPRPYKWVLRQALWSCPSVSIIICYFRNKNSHLVVAFGIITEDNASCLCFVSSNSPISYCEMKLAPPFFSYHRSNCQIQEKSFACCIGSRLAKDWISLGY